MADLSMISGRKKNATVTPVFTWRSLVIAVMATVIGSTVLTACSLVAGTNPNIPATGTPPTVIENTPVSTGPAMPAVIESAPSPNDIIYGKAVVAAGVLEYQIEGRDPVFVQAHEEVPVGSAVRIWNNDTVVEMKLEDDAVIMLAPFTTIHLINEQSTSSHTMVLLESGAILVVSENLWVISADHQFRIWASGSIVGVRSDPSQKTLAVNCFGPQGGCLFNGLGDSTELTAGQQLEYKTNIRGEIRGADFDEWRVFFGDILPTPTLTPTPTMTPAPTSTPTPLVTPTSGSSTIPLPTDSATKEQSPDPEERNNNGGGGDPDDPNKGGRGG